MSKFSKKKEQQEVDQKFNQIEGYELDKLRADMEAKKQVRMNGRLQSRFTQVMLDRNVVRFPNEKEFTMGPGELVVRAPVEYAKWQNAEAMIEASDRKQEDSYFAAYPEEKAKDDERVAGWISEIRQMLRTVIKRS